MREILSVTCGFRNDIIEKIINEHFKLDSVKEDGKIKTGDGRRGRKPSFGKFAYNGYHARPYIIVRVDRNGKFYGTSREFSFNMDQVLYIKKRCSDDLTYWDISKISEKLNLGKGVVGRIIWNLEQGNFDKFIIDYQNQMYAKPKPIVENNPQKRKEMGLYGV